MDGAILRGECVVTKHVFFLHFIIYPDRPVSTSHIHSLVLVYTVESISVFLRVILSRWFIRFCLYSSIHVRADYIVTCIPIDRQRIGKHASLILEDDVFSGVRAKLL
jgi:hypothetical protein